MRAPAGFAPLLNLVSLLIKALSRAYETLRSQLFLLWLSSVRDCNPQGEINSFLPKLHLVMAFITATERKLKLLYIAALKASKLKPRALG